MHAHRYVRHPQGLSEYSELHGLRLLVAPPRMGCLQERGPSTPEQPDTPGAAAASSATNAEEQHAGARDGGTASPRHSMQYVAGAMGEVGGSAATMPSSPRRGHAPAAAAVPHAGGQAHGHGHVHGAGMTSAVAAVAAAVHAVTHGGAQRGAFSPAGPVGHPSTDTAAASSPHLPGKDSTFPSDVNPTKPSGMNDSPSVYLTPLLSTAAAVNGVDATEKAGMTSAGPAGGVPGMDVSKGGMSGGGGAASVAQERGRDGATYWEQVGRLYGYMHACVCGCCTACI